MMAPQTSFRVILCAPEALASDLAPQTCASCSSVVASRNLNTRMLDIASEDFTSSLVYSYDSRALACSKLTF